MKFAELLSQSRRLALLQGLSAAVGYRLGARMLRAYCQAVGVTALVSDVETDLAWLSLAGLVTLEAEQGVSTATLTRKGLDVAQGLDIVDGVKRPEPD